MAVQAGDPYRAAPVNTGAVTNVAMRAHSPDAADGTAADGTGTTGWLPLDSLTDECRWVTWRHEPRGAHGALVRTLYRDVDCEAKVDDSKTWIPHDAAWAVRHQIGGTDAGIGVMLGPVNGTWPAAVYLISCRDPLTGRFMPWAATVLETLDTYVQIGASGADAVAFLLIDPGDAGALRALLDAAGDSHVAATRHRCSASRCAVQRLARVPGHRRADCMEATTIHSCCAVCLSPLFAR
jgi:hypothetical protein